MIENNTYSLKSELDTLNTKLNGLSKLIRADETYKKIGDLPQITKNDKLDMLETLKKIIDKYEKCNFIIESAGKEIPFPYTEVVIHGFMIVLCILALLYAYLKYSPFTQLRDLKKLYKLREDLEFANPKDLTLRKTEVDQLYGCHKENMISIMFALKVTFFMFIVIFLIFYSVKIISSANDFKSGLYNSFYFEESQCYT